MRHLLKIIISPGPPILPDFPLPLTRYLDV